MSDLIEEAFEISNLYFHELREEAGQRLGAAIDAAVLAERKRCAALVRYQWPDDDRSAEAVARAIEEGRQP